MDQKWRIEQVPAQPGSVAVVTGANSGVGYGTALALAKKGGQGHLLTETAATSRIHLVQFTPIK